MNGFLSGDLGWFCRTAVVWLSLLWTLSSAFRFAAGEPRSGRSWTTSPWILLPLAAVFLWGAQGSLPLLWPLLSGWGWLFLGSLLVVLSQILSLSRRSNASLVAAGLLSIVFALPAWTTRSEDSLLRGTIALGGNGALVLLLVGLLLSAVGGLLDRNRQWARAANRWMVYGLLSVGSVLFSIPFFWLLLTSFKEERDMMNANGLVWVPKVTRTVQALDPLSPLYETAYQGTTVQVEKRGAEPTGIRVSVVRPGSLAGSSLVVSAAALREVPREMKVVTAVWKGVRVEAALLNEDGEGAHLKILSPADRRDEVATLPTSEVDPVRNPGLLWKNYPDALASLPPEAEGGFQYLRNTLMLCLLCVTGTLTSCTLVAYGFARLRFPGRGFLFSLLLATMMLPGAVTMLPSFLIFRELGWVDSLAPIWAPTFFGSAFNIFLLRQFFLTLPRELEDAAKIDGCSQLRTLWSVMAPQIKPALVVVGIWTFIGAWNNFMGPLIYVSSPEKMTIAYAMQLFAGDKSNQPGLLMAFATMALTPVILIFFFAQRAFVEGIALTGRTG